MEKAKTLWFRAGIAIQLTEEEYATVHSGGIDGANDDAYNAAAQVILSKIRQMDFRLTGETYAPAVFHEPQNEWSPEEDLNFDFDEQMVSPTPEKLDIKVIDNNGNYTSVLVNSSQPAEAEYVRIDKDYEDYEQLQTYAESLEKNQEYKECDLTFAHFEPDNGPNTKISYLYRDAGNYKVWNEAIIKGGLNEEQIARILECADGCECSGCFIPSKVGLPETTMVDEGFGYDEELDNEYFEIDEYGFEPTTEEPTVAITADELVADFERWAGKWHLNALPDPAVIKMTTIHFTSVEEGADCTQFDTQDVGELMELLHHFLRENNLTLKSVDSIELCEEVQ